MTDNDMKNNPKEQISFDPFPRPSSYPTGWDVSAITSHSPFREGEVGDSQHTAAWTVTPQTEASPESFPKDKTMPGWHL